MNNYLAITVTFSTERGISVMATHELWTISLLCCSLVTAVPLSSFYPYGSANGDSTLGAFDDVISPSIATSVPFYFYGNAFSNLYVSASLNIYIYIYTFCMLH